jgi:hypothetical protein
VVTRDQISYGDSHVNGFGRLPDGGDWVNLSDANKPQLYASPALKIFLAPALTLTFATLDFSAYKNQEASSEYRRCLS